MSAIFRCDVGDGSKNKDFKVSFDFSRVRKVAKTAECTGRREQGRKGEKRKKKRKLNKLQPVNVTALLHGAGATFLCSFVRYRLSFVCSRLLV